MEVGQKSESMHHPRARHGDRLAALTAQLLGGPGSTGRPRPLQATPAAAACAAAAPNGALPKIAVICTSYFAGSHADVLVSKWVHGFPTDGGLLPPRSQVTSR